MPHKIYILKPIWDIEQEDWAVSDKMIINQLNSIKEGEDIEIYINSPGGLVTTGLSIYNAILAKTQTNNIISKVVGLCGSAATFIGSAANEFWVAESSQFHIHNGQGGAIGDFRVFEKYARTLKKMNAQIINIYKRRSKLTKGQIQDLMNNDEMMTPEEALEAGLIDKIYKPEEEDIKELNVEAYWGFNSVNELNEKFIKPHIKNYKELDVQSFENLINQSENQNINNHKEEEQMPNELEAKVTSLENQLSESNSKIIKLEASNGDLKQQVTNLESELDRERSEKEQLRNTIIENEVKAEVAKIGNKIPEAEVEFEIEQLVEMRKKHDALSEEDQKASAYTKRLAMLNARNSVIDVLGKSQIDRSQDGSEDKTSSNILSTLTGQAFENELDSQANALAKKEGITYSQAYEKVMASLGGEN